MVLWPESCPVAECEKWSHVTPRRYRCHSYAACRTDAVRKCTSMIGGVNIQCGTSSASRNECSSKCMPSSWWFLATQAPRNRTSWWPGCSLHQPYGRSAREGYCTHADNVCVWWFQLVVEICLIVGIFDFWIRLCSFSRFDLH